MGFILQQTTVWKIILKAALYTTSTAMSSRAPSQCCNARPYSVVVIATPLKFNMIKGERN